MTLTTLKDMLSQFLTQQQQQSAPQEPEVNPPTAANNFASPLVPVERGGLSKKRKLFSDDSTVKSSGKKMKLQPQKESGLFYHHFVNKLALYFICSIDSLASLLTQATQ